MRLPATAHNIKRTGPCRASGAHLSDAANEPTTFRQIEERCNAEARQIMRNGGFTDAELLAADLARNADKHASRDHDALQTQVHMLRCFGAL